MDGLKIYKITADYRPSNPNKPHYYVGVDSNLTIKQVKERFSNVISWLKIYECRPVEDDEIDEIKDTSQILLL